MPTEYEIAVTVGEKFNQLTDQKLSGFTTAERRIWFIVLIRTEMDMEGFDSIFDQLLRRSQVIESIGYIRDVGLGEIADQFQRILDLLDLNGYYDSGEEWSIGVSDLPENVVNEIEMRGKGIQNGHKLWHIDRRLLELLQAEDGGQE